MNKIQLDKNKATTFKGKRPKKILPLEILKDPESITSHMMKDYICINDELFALDYYDFKGDLKNGGGDYSFCYSDAFWSWRKF